MRLVLTVRRRITARSWDMMEDIKCIAGVSDSCSDSMKSVQKVSSHMRLPADPGRFIEGVIPMPERWCDCNQSTIESHV